VPIGRLIEKSRKVIWDLKGVKEGTYTATVEASDKHRNTGSGSITVTVVVCPGWLPDPPPCPTISVACRSRVDPKEPITFEATVAGGDSDIKPTYKWSLSAGKIINGQATRKISVDASRLKKESITAKVKVGGAQPSCNNVASCTVELGEPKLQ
jgi:hypothetical protein